MSLRPMLFASLVASLTILAACPAAGGQQPTWGTGTQPADTAGQTPIPTQPATQPAATQPATAPVNPLRSPYEAMQFFLRTVRDPQRGDEKYQAAMRCLDFGSMDEEKLRIEGPLYVRKLDEILRELEKASLFDPEDKVVLPDEPTGTVQTFGRDPLALELRRLARKEPDPVTGAERTVLEWKLPGYIVAEVPGWHERLAELIARLQPEQTPAEPAEETGVSPEALRTARHTIRFFLEEWNAAQKKSERYAAALACLDFSEVVRQALAQEEGLEDAAEIEEALRQADPAYARQVMAREGIKYVDGLKQILQALLDDGSLVLEDLPDKPELYVKPTYSITSRTNEAVYVTLVRQGEAPGQWRFNARMVKDVPQIVAALGAGGSPAPAEMEPVSVPGETAKPKPITGGAAAQPTATSLESPRDETASPRATLQTFLDAMQEGDLDLAVTCLDLSELSEQEHELAPIIAGKLWLVMTRTQKVLPDTLSGDTAAPKQDPLFTLLPAGWIQISKELTGERKGEWLFSSQTVRDIEQLYDAVEGEPAHESWAGESISLWVLPSLYVREYLVYGAAKRLWWGLQLWQWAGLVLLVLLGLAIRWICLLVLPRIARRMLQTETTMMLPATVRRALAPTATLMLLVTWWAGLQFLDLGAGIMAWTWWVLKIAMTLGGVYAFYRLIDVVMGYFAARAAQTTSRLDDVLVPLLQKTLKVVVVAVGFVLFIKMLGFQVTPLLAGLGVGGLAFGLAAQDTLKNFFGSVNVVLDRPFQVGDWIKLGDVEGTVESVGMRSSRIRTFYNSQVTVPNSEIMTARVDNLGRRRFRRISCMISVTYDTPPEKLEAFCEGVRTLIRTHPYTRKDYYHCWVNKFAASSIDILLYCFHETPEWATELRERHRLFLDIVRLARRLGVEFAFPTQTVHLHHDSTPPDSPPPPAPTPPPDADAAMQFGREEAAKIVREAFGEKVEKPPPVEF